MADLFNLGLDKFPKDEEILSIYSM